MRCPLVFDQKVLRTPDYVSTWYNQLSNTMATSEDIRMH
jgi:hypothetical protein